MIGLVLPFQLSTPTIRFSLDHKRNVSDEAVSGIGMLLSLDHKLCASDYYSDSVASENQHLQTVRCMMYKLTSSYLETLALACTPLPKSEEERDCSQSSVDEALKLCMKRFDDVFVFAIFY